MATAITTAPRAATFSLAVEGARVGSIKFAVAASNIHFSDLVVEKGTNLLVIASKSGWATVDLGEDGLREIRDSEGFLTYI